MWYWYVLGGIVLLMVVEGFVFCTDLWLRKEKKDDQQERSDREIPGGPR